MLQYFDAHVRAEALDMQVLENLAYFNVRAVLVAAHAPERYQTSAELLAYFCDMLSNVHRQIEVSGIRPYFALGVHPKAVPRRAHFELWRELPFLLGESNVVAVGELKLEEDSPEQEALLIRQLEIATEAGLPVLMTAARRERSRKVRRLVELVEQVGAPVERVLINHLDYSSLRVVLRSGCWAGVTISPQHLMGDVAAQMIRRYGSLAVERSIFNSGLRLGPMDVLAMPKASLALSEEGHSPSEVRSLVWSNAVRLFVQ